MNINNMVYHYTDANALIQIVTNRKLWATHIDYLNDSNEGDLARKHIKSWLSSSRYLPVSSDEYTKNVIQHFVTNYPTYTYVTSFCKSSDNLSLYRTYTPKEGGYCIGFDIDYLKQIPSIEFTECEYDTDIQKRDITDFLRNLILEISKIKESYPEPLKACNHIIKHSNYRDRLARLSVRYKSQEFSSEAESRIYFKLRNMQDKDGQQKKLRASSKGHLIIPYMEFDLPNIETEVTTSMGPNTDNLLAGKGYQQLYPHARANGSKWKFILHGGLNSGFRHI